MKKLLTLLVCLSGLLCAQMTRDYTISYSVTLAGGGAGLTIQQPATDSKTVHFVGVYVYCPTDCDVQIDRDGTAATSTAQTPVPTRSTLPASKAKAFVGTNNSAGSTIGLYSVTGGGSITIPLTGLALYGDGVTKNVNIRTGAVTGTAKIVIQFSEDN